MRDKVTGALRASQASAPPSVEDLRVLGRGRGEAFRVVGFSRYRFWASRDQEIFNVDRQIPHSYASGMMNGVGNSRRNPG
jgi:hypothetical protein